ncbi:MAG: outer membrane beta-barrel protein [Burkholderiales bacterium]
MKKLLLAAALCPLLLAAPAGAQSANAAQWYIGAGIGAARTDSDATSYKLYLGNQITRNWGVELGYQDLGRYRSANIDTWTLAGTGTLPLSANWSILGKLGVAWSHARFAGSSNRNAELLAGIGVSYAFDRNLGVRLEYEDFGKLSDAGGGNHSRGNALTLSLKYSF